MLIPQGFLARQTLTHFSRILFSVVAGYYKNKASEWFFEVKDIFLYCVASACQHVALTSLEENMVESRQELIFVIFDYFFCSIYMILFYSFSKLFQIQSC